MYHGKPHKRRFDVAPRQGGIGNSTESLSEIAGTTSSTSVISSTSSPSTSSSALTGTSSVSSDQTGQTRTTSSTTFSSIQTSSSRASSVESSASSTGRTASITSSTTSSQVFSSLTSTPLATGTSSSATSIVNLPTSPLSPVHSTTAIIITGPSSNTPTSIVSTFTFSPSATKEPASGIAEGFWQNKGAVAGTFTALGVFVLGIMVAFIILRRRARRTQSEDELFENFAVTPGLASQTVSSHGHMASPHPSVAELAVQTPMDVYSENRMYNGSHGPDYPPGTSYGFAPVGGVVNPYPDYSDPQMSQQLSYPAPSLAQTQVPNHHIPFPARAVYDQQAAPRGSYQRSIDSFYGAS